MKPFTQASPGAVGVRAVEVDILVAAVLAEAGVGVQAAEAEAENRPPEMRMAYRAWR